MTKGGKAMLGLAVSALSLNRGECRTFAEMKCFCDAAGERISRERLRQIHEKALRRIGVHLGRQSNTEIRQALQALIYK